MSKRAVEIGADLIVSGAGLPVNLPAYVKGSATKIAPIVSTEKAANVVLKYWDRKYGRTADMVIIEGPKAGGHLGFSRKNFRIIQMKNMPMRSETFKRQSIVMRRSMI